MTDRQIIIVGFMGTGKTTVANALARKLGGPMIDLDELITREQGRNPNEIIVQAGEKSFREIETQTLREVLVENAARIVAVGGGAWTIAENRQLIGEHGALTVWLDAPFELCWKRIEQGRAARPLASSRKLAARLFIERRPLYKLADARIPVAVNDNAEEIATKVAGILSQQPDN